MDDMEIEIDRDWKILETAGYSYGWVDCQGIEGKKLPTKRIMNTWRTKELGTDMDFFMKRSRRRVKEVEDVNKNGKSYKILKYEYDPQYTEVYVTFKGDYSWDFMDLGGWYQFHNIPKSIEKKFPLAEFVDYENSVDFITNHDERIEYIDKRFKFPEDMSHDDRFDIAMQSVKFIEDWFKNNPGVTTYQP